MRNLAALAFLLGSLVNVALGQVPPPTPSGGDYAPARTGSECPECARPALPEANTERLSPDQLEHLLAAVEHLEAAGLQTEAANLRRRATLAKKLAQMEALQAEIAQLRGAQTDLRQVMLSVRLVEVPRTEKSHAGLNHAGGAENLEDQLHYYKSALDGEKQHVVLDAGDPTFLALEMLQEHHLMRVLAEPRIITVSGRAASFRSGPTQIEFLPHVLDGNRIRLAFTLRYGDSNPPGTRVAIRRKITGLETMLELNSGQTMVLRIPRSISESEAEPYQQAAIPVASESDTDLLLLITPQLIESSPTPTTPIGEIYSSPAQASKARREQAR